MDENQEGDRSSREAEERSRSKPSLAERLMNPPRVEAPPAPRPPDRELLEREDLQRAARNELKTLEAFGSISNASITASLKEARRFVRVRYFSFLTLLLVLAATLIVAVVVLTESLLNDGRWEVQAGSAAVAAGALAILVLMQYRPASTYSSASVELAQLEALRIHLEHSYGVWNEFLTARRDRDISANEIATAVASMTSTTRELVSLQAEFMSSNLADRGSRQPPRPSFPTPTMPDPRRY